MKGGTLGNLFADALVENAIAENAIAENAIAEEGPTLVNVLVQGCLGRVV